MSKDLTALRPEAIETLAQIIGDNFTGGQITSLFRRSGFDRIAHDGSTKWRFVADALTRLQAEARGQPHSILQVVRTAANPQGWIDRREAFEKFLADVNKVLGFYGLCINERGEMLAGVERATTVRPSKNPDETAFDARGFHSQVIVHGRTHFCRGAYFHAVFECCKAFDAAVRNNTGIGKSGQPLMSEALSLNGPVKLNAQTKQSEKDEQQGVMYLCMGLMNAVRNPQAHEPELHWPMSREDALDVLGLTSFLFRKLEKAVVLGALGAGAVPVRF